MSLQIGPHTFDRARYDHDADVLYISQGDPARAVDFDETPDGHAVSYDKNGNLIGLTLIGVRRLVEEAQKDEEIVLRLPTKIEPADLKSPELELADLKLADLKPVLA